MSSFREEKHQKHQKVSFISNFIPGQDSLPQDGPRHHLEQPQPRDPECSAGPRRNLRLRGYKRSWERVQQPCSAQCPV